MNEAKHFYHMLRFGFNHCGLYNSFELTWEILAELTMFPCVTEAQKNVVLSSCQRDSEIQYTGRKSSYTNNQEGKGKTEEGEGKKRR